MSTRDFWGMISRSFGLSLFLLVQCSGPAKDPVQSRIQKFHAAIVRADSDSARIRELENLVKLRDDRIVTALGKHLLSGTDRFRKAVANEIARNTGHEEGARALMRAAEKESDLSLKSWFIRSAASMKVEAIAPDVHALFEHKDLPVAGAALKACEAMRLRDSVPLLISLLDSLETLLRRAAHTEEEVERIRTILPETLRVLKSLTGERYNKARDWSRWWSKRGPTFRVRDR